MDFNVAKLDADDFLTNSLKPQASKLILQARANSDDIIERARGAIETWAESRVDLAKLCFVAVGSVGRREALPASDLDLIPIAQNEEALAAYQKHDQELRFYLADQLGLKISRGEDLTRCTATPELVAKETIGGPDDGSAPLTKRILILTEGRSIGGNLAFDSIQSEIIQAYGGQDRSSGRHVLSLCNDIARYYRTLCIEYKWKADDLDKDWCTRNLKLRHSRKFWYFSCIVAIVSLAEKHPRGEDDYTLELRKLFQSSPVDRLVGSPLAEQPIELARLIEHYVSFLEFMASPANRQALAEVEYDRRYTTNPLTAFPMLKFNSDLLHSQIMNLMDGMSSTNRQRVYDWFLF